MSLEDLLATNPGGVRMENGRIVDRDGQLICFVDSTVGHLLVAVAAQFEPIAGQPQTFRRKE